MNKKNKLPIFKRIWLVILAVGPGIFCIGYTIGTGSVTAMAKAGSEFGSQLLWVLTLSVIFSGVMMEAYGRYAVVTGETAMHSIRNRFRYGNILAIAIIIGVVFAQWTCLSGIMGLSANAVYELLVIFYPGISTVSYWVVLIIAILITIVLYRILLGGKYSFFEKVLIVFVTIMGICFIIYTGIIALNELF